MSSDELSSSIGSEENETSMVPAHQRSMTSNKEIMEILPSKEDVYDHFEKMKKKVNGMECCYCKYCKAEAEENDNVRLLRTRYIADTMLRHLCRCKYFLASKGIKTKKKCH